MPYVMVLFKVKVNIILLSGLFKQVRTVKLASDLVKKVYARTITGEKVAIPLTHASFRKAHKNQLSFKNILI